MRRLVSVNSMAVLAASPTALLVRESAGCENPPETQPPCQRVNPPTPPSRRTSAKSNTSSAWTATRRATTSKCRRSAWSRRCARCAATRMSCGSSWPRTRMSDLDSYGNPLTERYASKEMSRIFSARFKFETWRRLWLWLAEEEKRLGLPISDEAVAQMRAAVGTIDFESAAREEESTRHDVMAHVREFGRAAPAASRIIHWGATSAFVSDNGDLIQMREELALLERRLAGVLKRLRAFALAHRDLPALAYTHYQPAQPTTVGKRAAMWSADLLFDLEALRAARGALRFLGVKGATGTQASFLSLFDGDSGRVEELDRAVARRAGFERRVVVSGQTYSRKYDDAVLHALSGLAQSAHKIATDLRLLQHDGEIEEPSEASQVGSSAMPHKKNPMRAERIC